VPHAPAAREIERDDFMAAVNNNGEVARAHKRVGVRQRCVVRAMKEEGAGLINSGGTDFGGDTCSYCAARKPTKTDRKPFVDASECLARADGESRGLFVGYLAVHHRHGVERCEERK
jgi:hypothetical protein